MQFQNEVPTGQRGNVLASKCFIQQRLDLGGEQQPAPVVAEVWVQVIGRAVQSQRLRRLPAAVAQFGLPQVPAAGTAVANNFGLLIGFFTGMISFIPYVGSTVGLVLSIGVALVQFWHDRPIERAQLREILRAIPDLGRALGRVVAGEAEVLTIAVHPDQRRVGLGGALVGAFLAEAVARGGESAFLEVAEGNTAARALYARAGFEECPPFEGYWDDPNSVFMTKVLA